MRATQVMNPRKYKAYLYRSTSHDLYDLYDLDDLYDLRCDLDHTEHYYSCCGGGFRPDFFSGPSFRQLCSFHNQTSSLQNVMVLKIGEEGRPDAKIPRPVYEFSQKTIFFFLRNRKKMNCRRFWGVRIVVIQRKMPKKGIPLSNH